MWHSFFDRIFVITLDHYKSEPLRLRSNLAKQELGNHGIPFDWWQATYNDNGAYGCFLSYQKLFNYCLEMGYRNILVFEDDLKIIHPSPNSVLAVALDQLPEDYHTIHLGPNTHVPLQYANRHLLLTMNQCRSTHAQGYSQEAMKQIISYEWTGTPIDQMIEEKLQPLGKCFCTYPLLVTQRNGFSDIDKREVNMYYIQERFENNTKHLR